MIIIYLRFSHYYLIVNNQVCKDTNFFETDKIYFHFFDKNDGYVIDKEVGIEVDNGGYYCVDREKRRARPEVSPLVVLGGGICLRLSEEGEDDLDLFWGEDFAGAGVAGGLEGGEEGFVGMDFVGEAFACSFLAVVREIG